MKISKQSVAGVLFNVLFLIASTTFAASEEQVGNSRLNGKWEGRPPLGGELTMTLTVENDNQIPRVRCHSRGRKKRSPSPSNRNREREPGHAGDVLSICYASIPSAL